MHSGGLRTQANGRLHRRGQPHTVTVYDIVARDTVDEAVLDVLKRKRTEENALIEALRARG